ncbi:MAG: type I-A CRISPR-associated protein Cas5 [Candidatus Micrarchaeia archaeon]|uniref:hypothetical protein n=1 Tax=Saccharolobus sp. TaxID=2100761 RepID=UPI00316AAD03
MPVLILITFKPHGIIALRVSPQSKMRISFKHPPLTSLIGALAYPLFSEDRYETLIDKDRKIRSKADELRKMLIGVSIHTINGSIMYGPLFRINRLYHKVAESAITSLPLTVIYGNENYEYQVAYIFDEQKLENYSIRDLERAAWGVSRIGSRESVVYVESVKSAKIELLRTNIAETFFSFPYDMTKSIQGRYDIEQVVDWKTTEIGDYSRSPRIRLVYPLERNVVEGLYDFEVAKVEFGCIIVS